MPDSSAPVAPGYRVRNHLRRLPIYLAAVIAIAEVATYGGLFFPDTVQFLRHTWSAGFAHKPYFNVIPPGYPLVLDAVVSLAQPRDRMLLLILLQQGTVIVGAWLVLRIGELLGWPRLGWSGALATILYLPLGLFAQSAQTETFFVFWYLLALYFAGRGAAVGSRRAWLASGCFAAVAMAQRTVGVAIPVAIVLALWLSRPPNRNPAAWRDRGRHTAAFLAGLFITLASFVGANYAHFGRIDFVAGTGIHLFGRVAQIEKTAPDTPEIRQLKEVAREAGLRTIFFENAGWALARELSQRTGMSDWQADALLRRAALETFLSDVPRTMWLTLGTMDKTVRPEDSEWQDFWGGLRPETYPKFLETSVGPWKAWEQEYRKMESLLPGYSPRGNLGSWAFPFFGAWLHDAQWLARGRWNLVAMILAGIIGVLRRDFATLLLAGVPFGLLAAACLGDQPLGRYWEVALPAFFLMCLVGAATVWQMFSRRQQNGRRRKLHPALIYPSPGIGS
jgi:uncharacterized membrane protein (UPF0136 family)